MEILDRLMRMLREDLSKKCNRDLTLVIGKVPIMWDKRGYLVLDKQSSFYKAGSQ